MEKSSSQELYKELEVHKQAISALRDKLSTLSNKRHSVLTSRREVGQAIAARLRRVKTLREERNKLTDEVKKHKEEREKIQKAVHQKLLQVKEVKQHSQGEKRGTGPGAIKHKMDILERRIETEPMSFDAEQKIMKQIKLLRKERDDAEAAYASWEQVRALEKELKDLKRSGEEQHSNVQHKAEESQKKHEEMVGLLKEVDELRKQEEKLVTEVTQASGTVDSVRGELEHELTNIGKLGKEVDFIRDERRKKKQEATEKTIEGKARIVAEKMKKGEKLTTEDLLAWQAGKDI